MSRSRSSSQNRSRVMWCKNQLFQTHWNCFLPLLPPPLLRKADQFASLKLTISLYWFCILWRCFACLFVHTVHLSTTVLKKNKKLCRRTRAFRRFPDTFPWIVVEVAVLIWFWFHFQGSLDHAKTSRSYPFLWGRTVFFLGTKSPVPKPLLLNIKCMYKISQEQQIFHVFPIFATVNNLLSVRFNALTNISIAQ